MGRVLPLSIEQSIFFASISIKVSDQTYGFHTDFALETSLSAKTRITNKEEAKLACTKL